jgi:hypothetical protein
MSRLKKIRMARKRVIRKPKSNLVAGMCHCIAEVCILEKFKKI